MHNPRGRDPANTPRPQSSPRAAPASSSSARGKERENPPGGPGTGSTSGPPRLSLTTAPSSARENGALSQNSALSAAAEAGTASRPAPASLAAGAAPRAVFPRGKPGGLPPLPQLGAHLVDVVAHSLPEPLQVHPPSLPRRPESRSRRGTAGRPPVQRPNPPPAFSPSLPETAPRARRSGSAGAAGDAPPRRPCLLTP